jgi:phosphopantetheinyl transferase (holo-ACP synthase)
MSGAKGYGARAGSSSSKRSRAEELAEVFAASEASSSAASVPVQASGPSAAAAPGMPINISAELAAGRTKIGRSSFWNEEKV